MLEFMTRPPRQSPVGTYRIDVISLPEECDGNRYVPAEIRYIFRRHSEYKEKIRAVLAGGKAIGVRTVLRAPENILRAVHTVSVHTKENYIITWLPQLLRNKHLPKFSESDCQRSAEHGENLQDAVEGLLDEGHAIAGGVVFGLSAVALSLTTAIQSFFLYRQNLKKLAAEGKARMSSARDLTRLALIQDFINPARLGLLLGAAMAPVMGIAGSVMGLMHNGWVLALIGSTESIVAGITIIFSGAISERRFRLRLQR